MKIVAIDIPDVKEVNLKSISMQKLGPLVAIAGRNGAGKSRILRVIEQRLALDEASIAARVQDHKHLIRHSPEHRNNAGWTASLSSLEKQLTERRSITLSEDRQPRIVRFVPNNLNLTDPQNLSPANTRDAANNINNLGVNHLHSGVLARIQVCQNRWWEATHPERTIPADIADRAIVEYDRLKKLIGQFLNTEITRSVNGEAEVFDLGLGSSALSDGQKVILQLCVAIHAQASELNDVIIFMDEPENHLHPAALLELIEAVRAHLINGQLWIATHSVPLLANIESSSIWWMEDGGISKAGSKPEIVLSGLLGDNARRERLAEFLDLPFVLASNQFASECLIPPPTAAAVSGDPQMKQISKMVAQLRESHPSIRLLDYGAGKGRLAAEIADDWDSEQRSKIDYVAFDKSNADADECRSAIARLCGDSEHRLFHDITELRTQYDEGSFHVIVMCNVLHEVLPADWSELFGVQGKITRLLHEDGFLLLVEVQQLPYGECAHHLGFLVLDTVQLKKLFLISEVDRPMFVYDSIRDNWLKAHLISKALVQRFSDDSRRAALEDLQMTARDQVRELRRGNSSYRNGRLHGFWVQQFANSSLALT